MSAPFARSSVLSNLQTGGVKTFGLQLPKAKQQTNINNTTSIGKPKAKAFQLDDDDDDDDGASSDPRKFHPLQLDAIRSKRFAADAARVLAEDANAFQYDEVYDEQVASKKAGPSAQVQRLGLGSSRSVDNVTSAQAPAPAAQSRYITSLLSKSAQRKLEQESVYERNLLKDRAKDDEEHAGKQKFLTSAYKEQLAAQAEARAKQEEQDRRDEMIEQAKRKGGLMVNSALALAASRGVLEGMANKGGARVDPPIDKKPSTSAAPHVATADSRPHSGVTDSSDRNSSSKHGRDETSRHYDDDRHDAKRQKPSEQSTGETRVHHAESAAGESDSAVAPSSSSSAPQLSSVRVDAIASVTSQLTSGRNALSKAEEARARLAARKAATAGGH